MILFQDKDEFLAISTKHDLFITAVGPLFDKFLDNLMEAIRLTLEDEMKIYNTLLMKFRWSQTINSMNLPKIFLSSRKGLFPGAQYPQKFALVLLPPPLLIFAVRQHFCASGASLQKFPYRLYSGCHQRSSQQ